MSKLDHLERTAAEPRDRHIHEVNDNTRVFRLAIPQGSPPIYFLPGQWLDVYVPGVEKAGGFTITSSPQEARRPYPPSSPATATATATSAGGEPDGGGRPSRRNNGDDDGDGKGDAAPRRRGEERQGPYLELAVQRSPENPPAAWLWRDPAAAPDLLGAGLRVRVGGGFVWPPPGINVRALRRVVFVAGGVGVNPLVSMLSSLASPSASASASASASTPVPVGAGSEVRFLYSLRDPLAAAGAPGRREARRMLFVDRIARLFREGRVRGRLEVFLTGRAGTGEGGDEDEDGDGDNTIVCGGGGNGERDDDIDEGGEAEYTIPFHPRRCTVEDVAEAAGLTPAERRFAVVYVCGLPAMTDHFVARLTADRENGGGLGMEPHRVLCEKWW